MQFYNPMHNEFDPTIAGYIRHYQGSPVKPPKVMPTPEQRKWAFERIYPSLTDVETLKQVMRHAEDLAQWVANGNEA